MALSGLHIHSHQHQWLKLFLAQFHALPCPYLQENIRPEVPLLYQVARQSLKQDRLSCEIQIASQHTTHKSGRSCLNLYQVEDILCRKVTWKNMKDGKHKAQ